MLLTRPLTDAIDLLALQRLAPRRYPLLLESSAAGTAHGRWDLLLAAGGGSLALGRDGVTRRQDGSIVAGGFLDALDRDWRALRVSRDEPRWPFRGGWALLLSYELAGEVEPVLALPDAPGALPVAL
ncbi:MAG TPA: aminodeoxychorismate synthase, component I, partial [Xanthomonadaceae bacterium]|nr:aminodeoxychorismate synthase, component I [Xanthomonadaceae bacterium]